MEYMRNLYFEFVLDTIYLHSYNLDAKKNIHYEINMVLYILLEIYERVSWDRVSNTELKEVYHIIYFCEGMSYVYKHLFFKEIM